MSGSRVPWSRAARAPRSSCSLAASRSRCSRSMTTMSVPKPSRVSSSRSNSRRVVRVGGGQGRARSTPPRRAPARSGRTAGRAARATAGGAACRSALSRRRHGRSSRRARPKRTAMIAAWGMKRTVKSAWAWARRAATAGAGQEEPRPRGGPGAGPSRGCGSRRGRGRRRRTRPGSRAARAPTGRRGSAARSRGRTGTRPGSPRRASSSAGGRAGIERLSRKLSTASGTMPIAWSRRPWRLGEGRGSPRLPRRAPCAQSSRCCPTDTATPAATEDRLN